MWPNRPPEIFAAISFATLPDQQRQIAHTNARGEVSNAGRGRPHSVTGWNSLESFLRFGEKTRLSSGNKDETHNEEGETGGASRALAGRRRAALDRRREQEEGEKGISASFLINIEHSMEDTITVDKLIHSPVSPARRVNDVSKMAIRLHDVFTVSLNGQIHSENRHLYIPKCSERRHLS